MLSFILCNCDTFALNKPRDCTTPVPHSLTWWYQGSPSWRVIVHVDHAWAGNSCNRCHPRRFDPQLFVPEQVWEWERPQGSRWPESIVHHTDRLTEGLRRQNKPHIKLDLTIFLHWDVKEYRSNESVYNGTKWMVLIVKIWDLLPEKLCWVRSLLKTFYAVSTLS